MGFSEQQSSSATVALRFFSDDLFLWVNFFRLYSGSSGVVFSVCRREQTAVWSFFASRREMRRSTLTRARSEIDLKPAASSFDTVSVDTPKRSQALRMLRILSGGDSMGGANGLLSRAVNVNATCREHGSDLKPEY